MKPACGGKISEIRMHHYVLIRLLIKGSFVIPVMGMLCQVVAKAQTSIDAAPRLNEGGSVRQLERSWDQLNQQLNQHLLDM